MSHFKVLLLAALGACASAAPQGVVTQLVTNALPVASAAAPLVNTVVEGEDFDPHPQYNFGYSVKDDLTGDSKIREESRDGDVVRGSYSFAQADGRIRTVTYTADPVNGFQAEVTYDGQKGPVAIPFDGPAVFHALPAQPAAAPAVAVETAARTTAVVPAAPVVQRTAAHVIQAAPTTLVHASPAVHAVHSSPVSVFRTVPTSAVHAVHTAPTAVHAVHSAPLSVVRAVPATTAVHAVHAAPTAVHAVHSAPLSVVRAVPATTAVHAVHAPAVHAVHAVHAPTVHAVNPAHTFLHNSSPIDLSQLRFVSSARVLHGQ